MYSLGNNRSLNIDSKAYGNVTKGEKIQSTGEFRQDLWLYWQSFQIMLSHFHVHVSLRG